MSRRVILVVGNPKEWESMRLGTRADDDSWEVAVFNENAQAMAGTRGSPVEAFVVEHRPGKGDGAALLVWAQENFPEAARVVVAELAEREDVLRHVGVSHQFLPTPVSPEILAGTIRSARLLGEAMPNEVLLALAEGIQVFPPLPSLYFRVLKELGSPDCSIPAVAEIVGGDLAMTTRLLQVINSGYYGLPRRITDLSEAMGLMGQETVKSLIVGIQLFLEHEHIKPLYFSINQLWRHSNAVANSARAVAQMETGSRECADEAYTAGLLHDLGKLVLASNFEAQYNTVQQIARDSHRPLWEVEAEEFGVSHAELGAFILGRWGMPAELLEATAFHHRPCWRGASKFSALTAVHVANALEHELHAPQNGLVGSTLDLPYIDSLGLMDRLDAWRACVKSGKVPVKPDSPKVSPEPPTVVPVTSDVRGVKRGLNRKKVFAAAATIIALTSVGIVLWTLRDGTPVGPVRARPAPAAKTTGPTVEKVDELEVRSSPLEPQDEGEALNKPDEPKMVE